MFQSQGNLLNFTESSHTFCTSQRLTPITSFPATLKAPHCSQCICHSPQIKQLKCLVFLSFGFVSLVYHRLQPHHLLSPSPTLIPKTPTKILCLFPRGTLLLKGDTVGQRQEEERINSFSVTTSFFHKPVSFTYMEKFKIFFTAFKISSCDYLASRSRFAKGPRRGNKKTLMKALLYSHCFKIQSSLGTASNTTLQNIQGKLIKHSCKGSLDVSLQTTAALQFCPDFLPN